MALDDKDDKIDSNRALKEINIENKNIKVSNETPNEYSKKYLPILKVVYR